MNVLQEINENGNTILIATHDFSLLKKYKARILRCKEGKIDEITSQNLDIEAVYERFQFYYPVTIIMHTRLFQS